MSFYLIKPCKSTAAFEAVPKKQYSLDFAEVLAVLESSGFTIIADAKVMIVVEKNETEISIYPNGKLLLKVDSQSAAEEIVDELEAILF